MNPNTPHDQDQTAGVGRDAVDAPADVHGAGGLAGNAYASRQWDPAADLDAAAPVLRSNDLQRLNRKALVFLGGIVGLLIIAALWMFAGARPMSRDGANRRDEKVVIPDLPPAALADTTTAPLVVDPVRASSPVPDVPPLPLQPSPPTPTVISADVAAPGHPREPSLVERRISAEGTPPPGMAPNPYTQALLAGMPGPAPGAPPDAAPMQREAASSARFLDDPDALLARGTYVRCVLETRIVTDIPGFTSCVVTESIYSINGHRLLLPKGSKLSGRYDTDANGPRVAVVWDRITTPNGIDVTMASPGVDNLGGAGHPGDFDAHWPSRVSAALMISLVSDAFKYAGERNGPRTTSVSNGVITQSPFDSNTARTLERLADQALNRSISRPATIIVNQGEIVTVYIAKDIDFSGVLARR